VLSFEGRKKLVAMSYYGLPTVTIGYQAGNLNRRDAEKRRERHRIMAKPRGGLVARDFS